MNASTPNILVFSFSPLKAIPLTGVIIWVCIIGFNHSKFVIKKG
jgi:hypothetical protein